MFTNTKPPVVKSSLGSTPWPTISTTKPWVEYVVLSSSTSTLTVGTVLTLVGSNSHELEQVANTPIWIHRIGSFFTFPDADIELAYYITAGNGGRLVDEGVVNLSNSGSVLNGESVHRAEIIIPAAISLPSSIGTFKTYPIRYIPLTVNGDIKEVSSVVITATRVATSTNLLNAVAMTNSGGIYTYNWQFDSSTPIGVYAFYIKANLNSSGTIFKEYYRLVETFKASEYNPQRVKSGIVL